MTYSKNSFLNRGVILMAAFIGVVYFYLSFYLPFTGDDLGYREDYIAASGSLESIIHYCRVHRYFSNARLADLLNPIPLVYMPLWLNALCCGVATAAFFILMVRWSGLRNRLLQFAVLALTAFTFRWDALWMEFVTQYNYVWPSAMILASIALIVSDRCTARWMTVLGIFLCPLAAGMHEAGGNPVCIGLILYFAVNRAWLTRPRTVLLVLFILGSIFTLLSPAHFTHSDNFVAPESFAEKVFGSAYYIVILIAVTLCLLIFDRKRLRALMHDTTLIFAAAAIASLAFVIVAGYGGRPAWYGQVYALIALCRIASTYTIRIPDNVDKAMSTALVCFLVFHFGSVAWWQHHLGKENDAVCSLIRKSPDGVVFYDYTRDTDTPFYLLNKTRGVPDTDDVYYLARLSQHIAGGKKVTILPAALSALDFNTFSGELHLSDDILTDRRLPGVTERSFYKSHPRFVVKQGQTELIERSFEKAGRTFYYYTPVDVDRGEK
ncbi:MAG: hypothetical protein HDS65_01540 [Bacteroidales bacterium]|nr:hypothetical protein [Bacteroidales bacterium]